MFMPINQWAEDDRPREKFLLKGKVALSDAELLAILIGSGSRNESAVQLCQRILGSVHNNLNQLGKLSVQQLTQFKGVGTAKALTIASALELGRRRREEAQEEQPKITTSAEVFHLMHPLMGELPHEEFWVILLNNSNKVIYKSQVSKGGITGTIVDTRLVFKLAFEHFATGIILLHNHPSGKLQPSDADVQLTKKFVEAGKHLDILILDHLILTEKTYFSFADENLL
ncbi:RadC family protein [Flavobacterium sp.]|uniref:RadC family protein n=1 Tax=Flavobacterium sp. TaxID=239 RepID=UPI003D0FB8C5